MSESDYAIRRRHRRLETTLPVRISTIEPERDPRTGRPFFRASHETCANVSRGGLSLRTCEPLYPGRRLLLELRLPGGQPVETIGRVAWSKQVLSPTTQHFEAELGVEFIGGASDQFSALADFIELADPGDAGALHAADSSE